MRDRRPPHHRITLTALALALVGSAGASQQPPDAEPGPSVPRPFLRALGTAQDGGLPHAACHGDHCVAARRDPARRRLVASLGLVVPRPGPGSAPAVYLVDATPDVREQLDRLADVRGPLPAGVDRTPVDGILLTHAHVGHYLGLAFFGFEAIHTRGLPVWATPRMARFLRENGPWSQLVEKGNVELVETEPGAPFRLPPEAADADGRAEATGSSVAAQAEQGDTRAGAGAGGAAGGGTASPSVLVTALRVPHRDEYSDTVGFRFEGPSRTAVYVPDTDSWRRWEPPLPELLRDVDVALLDATFYSLDELPGRDLEEVPHPLVTETMELLGERVRAGTLEVYLTHMNHSNPAVDPGSAARREIERRGFRVLAEGEEIGL